MRGAALAALLVLLAGGCAQVREVTGGPKDEQGPRLISASPADGSVRFVSDRFVLRFDERVQVKRPAAGLLVSPPIDPPPTIALAGAREVEVRWKAPLKPGTTYSFAVGEAIQDLTEGNPALGLTYVLSTGETLDSLALLGTVTDAFSLAPQAGVLVLAYAADDTTSFTKGRPAFATRTDEQGRFMLRHLPQAQLRLTALKDLNGNYRYDLPGEEIAFLESAVAPHASGDSTARPVVLRLFQERSAVQRVQSASITDDRAWRIVLARPAERIVVRDIAREGGRLMWRPEWSSARDTVLLWPSDTTALEAGRYELSTEAGVLDTLRYRPLRPMPYQLAARTATPAGSAPGSSRILASRPLASVDEALIRVTAEGGDVPFNIRRDSAEARALWVVGQGPWPADARLVMPPKALRDIYGATNDTLRLALGERPASAMGTLRVTLAGRELPDGAILELLDARGLVLRRAIGVALGQRIDWTNLEPGTCTLRLVGDADGNGRWDAGSWSLQRQPEAVRTHAEPIQVRAGWDLGVEWKLPHE